MSEDIKMPAGWALDFVNLPLDGGINESIDAAQKAIAAATGVVPARGPAHISPRAWRRAVAEHGDVVAWNAIIAMGFSGVYLPGRGPIARPDGGEEP